MPRPRPGPPAAPTPLRSRCPISSALDLLGDRWTLLVVRDLLLLDKHRYADFLASGEGISTNILAERLDRLEGAGLVERRRYQERPPRDEYHLTARGRELFPVLREMIVWANRHIPGTLRPPPGWPGEPPGSPEPPEPPEPREGGPPAPGAPPSPPLSARGRSPRPPPRGPRPRRRTPGR